MIVVDHQPDEWTLLRREAEYFMEVISGISFQPISVIIRLNDDQKAEISARGRVACQELAVHVADHWLDCEMVEQADEAEVCKAIHKWHSGRAA